MPHIIRQIAQELHVQVNQVQVAVDLLDGGATVPFVARYRKEATGGWTTSSCVNWSSVWVTCVMLTDRKETVLNSITEQGKLTPALLEAIAQAATKQDLEDIYLPFKQKRRTKGQMAREAGIEPLADKLFADPSLTPAGRGPRRL